MSRKRKLNERAVLQAIAGSDGNISVISERLGCSWHTADDFIKGNENCYRAYKDEEEIVLDMVESKAVERIKDGDGSMIRFYLATKGKRRGYTYEESAGVDDTAKDTEINITVGEDVEPVKADE